VSQPLNQLVADNLDIWTSVTERKSGAGRGGGKRVNLYGIKRLRALILDLAVRGKLVPQDGGDEPASALLTQIKAAKSKLIASGTAKIGKPLSVPDDWPFEIPCAWVWSQLGQVTNYGQTDKADPGSVSSDTWVLELEDVEKGTSRLLERVSCSDRPFQSQKNVFKAGDVIYGKLRPYLDKVLIADEPGVCTTEMVPMRGYGAIPSNFIRLFLKTPFFISLATEAAHGMNLPRLATEKAREAPFPLPPLAEQRRIVTKVDELMALCGALERESADALAAHQTLVEALLATLVNSADAADLAANWARLERHFDTLFTTDVGIDALKQTILDLAVHGKLVEQDERDEPASALIQDWKKAKGDALKSAGDRRIKAAHGAKRPPFSLPDHWAFQSFENIFLFIDYRGNTPPKTSDGISLITAKNVRMGYLDREPREFISEATFPKWMTRGLPQVGDLFFTTEAPLGNICQNDIEEPFAIAQRLICFQPYGDVNTRFFMLVVMSRAMQQVIDDQATGMTARGIKAAKLKPLPLPVPPAAEQYRIVAKVDELMALCDALKARIADAATTQRHLADAIVERAAA
jgi:type I restriction enzyme, S subunit